ncbi:hypothetical protein B2J93_445 [Marssonina coronariae]|uniref:Uncharacterized protein n=1 Tax=Diplocarpon coronariae TaxID=2795749 RepID=A0A218YSA0_9HELO|nr:hypothetical protein B2J93_445 [Marssonina coronariae]
MPESAPSITLICRPWRLPNGCPERPPGSSIQARPPIPASRTHSRAVTACTCDTVEATASDSKDLDLKLFATSKPSTRSARDAKVVTLSLPDPEDSRWPSAHRRTTPQTFPGRRVIVLQQRAGNENSPPRRGVVLCPGVRFIQLVGFALQPAEARKASDRDISN